MIPAKTISKLLKGKHRTGEPLPGRGKTIRLNLWRFLFQLFESNEQVGTCKDDHELKSIVLQEFLHTPESISTLLSGSRSGVQRIALWRNSYNSGQMGKVSLLSRKYHNHKPMNGWFTATLSVADCIALCERHAIPDSRFLPPKHPLLNQGQKSCQRYSTSSPSQNQTGKRKSVIQSKNGNRSLEKASG